MKRAPIVTAALLAAGPFAVAPAGARAIVTPYLEVQQVFSEDLGGHGDAVTYTGVGGGADVSVTGPRLNAQADFQYDHYFAWGHRYSDSDDVNGVARLDYAVTPQLTLEGAAFGTRAHGQLQGANSGGGFGDYDNTQQVYGFQVGPSYAAQFNDVKLAADYRYSWVHADDGTGTIDLGPGQPVLDNGFTTQSHDVQASVGMTPGTLLPVGWTVSGGYVRDQIDFLAARYTGSFVQAQFVYPITSAIAVQAGAGYETNRAGEDQILTDADGNAILGPDRRLQADQSRPRLLSYDESGLIWDVGVLWRPDQRTSLNIEVGRRYGETSVTGSLSYQVSPGASFQAVAYDDVESFGRQLSNEVGALPTSFTSPVIGTGGGLQGCVFGADGGKGGCLSALASVSSGIYRAQGGFVLFSAQHGLWTYGVGAGYQRRHYLTPQYGPTLVSITGEDDQNANADLLVSRRLSRVSSLTGTADVLWSDTGVPGVGSYTTYGATGTYDRSFSSHLSGSASLAVYSGSGGAYQQDVIGTALVGLRYQL